MMGTAIMELLQISFHFPDLENSIKIKTGQKRINHVKYGVT